MRDKYSIRHFYARQNTGLDWTGLDYSIQRKITLKEISLARSLGAAALVILSSALSPSLSRKFYFQAWNAARESVRHSSDERSLSLRPSGIVFFQFRSIAVSSYIELYHHCMYVCSRVLLSAKIRSS